MSSREFEKVVFVQFIMAQLLQKEEVSGVRQNPMLASLIFLMHCPGVPMAGVTAGYNGRYTTGALAASCSAQSLPAQHRLQDLSFG